MNYRCFRFALFLVASIGAALLGRAAESSPHWVGSWVSAQQLTEPSNLPPVALGGHTLREIIQPSLGGERLRLTLSNVFGNAPVVIEAATVAPSTGGAGIDPARSHALTFNGHASTTIYPGASLLSDPVDLKTEAFQNLAVSIYFATVPSNITGHPGSRTTSYIQSGNATPNADLPGAATTDHWYFLADLEVWAPASASAVLVLGDSITDGRGSTTNSNNRWPNQLGRRLAANPASRDIAVLNQGIGGNCVLHGGLGPTALARFDRDVLAPPGVRWLVILEGVNDLGGDAHHPNDQAPNAVAEGLIGAYQQFIARAHSHGLRVYGATIMPFQSFASYDTPRSEKNRETVNQWIRTSGAFDAVIDFDALTRDSEHHEKLAREVDGGDHLHPSASGYQIMADGIDLGLFQTAAAHD